MLQADEEIAVLRAGGDALELQQAAEPVGGEEGFQFVAFQRGEDGHGASCSTIGAVGKTQRSGSG
ncbi:hypothetical protein D3C81_1975160 [compost metagenome]